jgi:hypothetical protein
VAALAADDGSRFVRVDLCPIVRIVLKGFPHLVVTLDALVRPDVGSAGGAGRAFFGVGRRGGKKQKKSDDRTEGGAPRIPTD